MDPEAFALRFADIKARSRFEVAAAPMHALAEAGALGRLSGELSPIDWRRLLWTWRGAWARPKQCAPAGDWTTWLFLAGRGAGKTRAGAEWVREREEQGARSIALIGPTFRDVVRIMVQGDSGILSVCPPWRRPVWYEVRQELHWPSGAVGYVCTAEKPDATTGGNYDSAWCDEPILWPYLDPLWTSLQLALRRPVPGLRPQACVTSTPRPLDWLRRLIMSDTTHTTHGATSENVTLPESWHREMQAMLGGTRQGAQELEAELLGDNPEALFAQPTINAHRVSDAPDHLERIVVAIDPAVTTHRRSDATGIVVVGIDAAREIYILADATDRYTPEAWGDKAYALLDAWKADAFVVETNRAGDLPKSNLRACAVRRQQREPPIDEVLALGDKAARAMPVSTLYEKGRVHHVGSLPRLEAEMTMWDPRSGVSPNGLDALVHGVRKLTRIGEAPEPKRPDARAAWKGFVALGKRAQPSGRGTL